MSKLYIDMSMPRIYGPKYIYPNTYVWLCIDMDTTEQLLEDRKNGMGLQKAAKKYGMGVARIRKIEAENGMGKELVPAEPFPNEKGQISTEDIRKHFQEVQDSFAIALEEIQKNGEKIDQLSKQWEEEEILEGVEELDEKIDTQMDQQWISIGVGVLGLAFFAYTFLYPPKPEIRYVHVSEPTDTRKTSTKSKIPEME